MSDAPNAEKEAVELATDEASSPIPTYYANAANAVCSAEELVIDFGFRNVSDATKVDPLARIVLSLYHAKRLSNLMGRMVASYEQSFGPIEPDPAKRLVADPDKKDE